MKPTSQPLTQNLEERFEAWLGSQPLTPPPDFVARTLARIRAEEMLVSSAKGGDEAAIDTLIDRWLGEQPLDPDYEPAQLATQTRRAAEYEERQESRPKKAAPNWVVPFPAWARSAVALAAAACVVMVAYFSTTNRVATPTTVAPTLAQNTPSEDATDNAPIPAYYALASDPKAILNLSDSLSDGDVLLDADNDNILLGNDGSTQDDAVN